MNCIIVDDDQMTRTGLEYLCDRHPSIELVGSYESIAKASIALKEHMPDLVLLDVEIATHKDTFFGYVMSCTKYYYLPV